MKRPIMFSRSRLTILAILSTVLITYFSFSTLGLSLLPTISSTTSPTSHLYIAPPGPPRIHILRHALSPTHPSLAKHDNRPPPQLPLAFPHPQTHAHFLNNTGKPPSLIYDLLSAGPGIVVLNQKGRGFNQQYNHPFLELIESAGKIWDDKVNKQSVDLKGAVREYKRRYGMDPPGGFGEWWAFVERQGVGLVDEFDELMDELRAFRAMSPMEFRERMKGAGEAGLSLDMEKGVVKGRKGGLKGLVEGLIGELPKGFKVEIGAVEGDYSSDVLGLDQRDRAEELIRAGKYFTEEELAEYAKPKRNGNPLRGWFQACSPESTAGEHDAIEIVPANDRGKKRWYVHTFIRDHLATMNFCNYPWHGLLHGALQENGDPEAPSTLRPLLTPSKLVQSPSILTPLLSSYTNQTSPTPPKPWASKPDQRLYFRGPASGSYDPSQKIDWRESHRTRLHLLFAGPSMRDKEERRDWGDKDKSGRRTTLLPQGKDGYEFKAHDMEVLSGIYTDIGLVGEGIQCEGTPGLCDEINRHIDFLPAETPEKINDYKYLLDVDGNGSSEQFHELLSTGAAVLKMTAFPDWCLGRMVPWYHYIPVKLDYSDVIDIMSFFIGHADDQGKLRKERAHDAMGQKIGEAGRDFALRHWRWVDMQAYMYRLLLEVKRLESDDQEAASYKG